MRRLLSGKLGRKVWQDEPEIFIDAAVRPGGEGSGGDGAEAPELSPPPAIGPDGVPIEAKPSNAVESEKPLNVIGPNGVPIEAKPSNTVESEKPQNVIGPNGVPIEAKPSNTVESEKR